MESEIRVTREQLYERVWAEPVQSLAKQVGLSDVGLAKTCKRLKVPVPTRGFWAKKAAGVALKRQPLPMLPPHDAITPREAVFRPTPAVMPPLTLPEPVARQVAFENDPANTILVPNALRSPHPLVRKTRDAHNTNAPIYGPGRQPRLDIGVSNGLWHRALRIMDALVKAFEVRGWTVKLGAGDDRKSYVTILGEPIPFGIREPLKKVLNERAKPERLRDGTLYTPWRSKYRDEPSGLLALITRHPWGHAVDRSYVESATRPLEERLHAFMISLVSMANEEIEREERRRIARQQREETERQRLAEERTRQAEAERARDLERQSALWEKSRRIRDYVSAVRSAAEAQPGQLEKDSRIAEWLEWAESYASFVNPLQELERLVSAPSRPLAEDDQLANLDPERKISRVILDLPYSRTLLPAAKNAASDRSGG